MTGGAPEVRSDKSLTLLTFDILHMTFDIQPMDQWTNGPMDQFDPMKRRRKNIIERH